MLLYKSSVEILVDSLRNFEQRHEWNLIGFLLSSSPEEVVCTETVIGRTFRGLKGIRRCFFLNLRTYLTDGMSRGSWGVARMPRSSGVLVVELRAEDDFIARTRITQCRMEPLIRYLYIFSGTMCWTIRFY